MQIFYVSKKRWLLVTSKPPLNPRLKFVFDLEQNDPKVWTLKRYRILAAFCFKKWFIKGPIRTFCVVLITAYGEIVFENIWNIVVFDFVHK